ncbi:MAG: hypothetical protein KAW17_00065 [Candidatus Eisenbacteria sp.]|nr:hypothetical protein [Candidatus Eisenbacteria bacterium]
MASVWADGGGGCTADIRTVIWKEARALLSNRGSVLLGYGVIVLIFGGFILMDVGMEIAAGDFSRPLLVFSLLAVVLASSQTARSFAGERENRTLASLLCTRISDRNLFLGKVASIVLFTAAMITAAGALHVATINVVSRAQDGGWLFYQSRPELVPFMFLLPLSVASFASVVGVLISLRVRNVRGAYLLNLFSGAPALVIGCSVVGFGPWGRSWHEILGGTVLFFALLVVGFAHLAVKRFRRETLVVESA